MQVESRSGKHERKLTIAMIVDKIVLGAVAQKWDRDGLFSSRWANLVGKWCVDYYRKFSRAPGKEIESLFDRWAESREGRDKDTVKLVEKFLETLSGQYVRYKKESQTDYMLDVAGSYFTRVRLRQLREALDKDLEVDDITKAEGRVNDFHRVEIGLGAGVGLGDREAAKRAFLKKSKPLIRYPGAAGKFFGDVFERDGFVAFEGPEKVGKTWWLMDTAWRALLQGNRVAFFSVGDLSEDQAMRRFYARAARTPLKAEPYGYPISLEPPHGDQRFALATHSDRNPKLPLGWKTAHQKYREILKKLKHRETKHEPLQLFTYANSSISVLGIRSVLADYEREGWVPDVVVIDYADILAPIVGSAETRDQVNATWKAMRRMSQELHNLVVTASQTDAASYDTELIGMQNFSEDKRKRGHVTASFGINQGDEEKNNGVQRINCIVGREFKYSRTTVLHVANCFERANPLVLSTL